MNLKERKEVMKQIALEEYSNGGLIYRIIDSEDLDHIIEKVTDKVTKPNVKSVIDHNLTGEEQFVMLLSKTLDFIESTLTPLKHVEINLTNMLEDKVPKYLLCKKYWGDNKNIKYFNYSIKRMIIENFYENVKYIYSEYSEMFQNENITINLNLGKKDDVDLVFKFLVKLVWCCYDLQFNLVNLFVDYRLYGKDIKNKTKEEIEVIVHRHYNSQFEIIEHSYFKRINAVSSILS